MRRRGALSGEPARVPATRERLSGRTAQHGPGSFSREAVMTRSASSWTNSPDTGVSVGLVVASAFVPRTFARSLSSRSARDQGIVTGLATGLQYLLTVGTQDALQALAAEV